MPADGASDAIQWPFGMGSDKPRGAAYEQDVGEQLVFVGGGEVLHSVRDGHAA